MNEPAAAPSLTLFHAPGACSLASLAGLEVSGLAYTLEQIDLRADRTAYRAINPSGKVPALLIGKELLTENLAILYRISAMAPEAALFPTDPVVASQQLSLMAWFGNSVHITRRQIRAPMRFTPDQAAQAALVEAGRPIMWALLQEIETRLGNAQWFGGAKLGLSDAYALVFYGWGMRDEFPMAELARLTAWKDRMLSLPAITRALSFDTGPLAEEALQSTH